MAAVPAPLLPDGRGEVVPQPEDQAGRCQQVEQPEHESFRFRHGPVVAGWRELARRGGVLRRSVKTLQLLSNFPLRAGRAQGVGVFDLGVDVGEVRHGV